MWNLPNKLHARQQSQLGYHGQNAVFSSLGGSTICFEIKIIPFKKIKAIYNCAFKVTSARRLFELLGPTKAAAEN
jgi:hypothetical protein